MTHVEACGVAFGGDHNPIGGLIYQRLVDWDGRPAARGGGDSIPGGQGVYGRTQELRDSRVISIEAAIVADSAADYFDAKRRVENMPMFGEMRVDQGDGIWSRSVEVEQINIPDAYEATETEFTIDLIAPDPLRYRDPVFLGPIGLPVRSGGLVLPSAFPWNFGTSIRPLVTVVNDGKVPSFPIVRVHGSASGITVHGGPRRIEFGAFEGDLLIENRARRVWLNGGEVTRQLIRRDWQSVPAESSQDFFFEASDAAPDTSMTVEYRIGAW